MPQLPPRPLPGGGQMCPFPAVPRIQGLPACSCVRLGGSARATETLRSGDCVPAKSGRGQRGERLPLALCQHPDCTLACEWHRQCVLCSCGPPKRPCRVTPVQPCRPAPALPAAPTDCPPRRSGVCVLRARADISSESGGPRGRHYLLRTVW